MLFIYVARMIFFSTSIVARLSDDRFTAHKSRPETVVTVQQAENLLDFDDVPSQERSAGAK